MPLPRGPRPKLPPSPVNPLRQLVQEGREQVARARADIRSLADDLQGTTAQPPTETKTSPGSPSAGTACLPCTRDHYSTTSAALSEGLRFARSEGMKHAEVIRRLGIALDELNIMERIDLAPDQIGRLNEPARKLAIWALNNSRELRHTIGEIKTVDDMEKAAAQAARVREEFMTKYGEVRKSSTEECEECGALEALKTYLERRKRGGT